MFVLEAIRKLSRSGRVALVNRGERLTFAGLETKSNSFAEWLLTRFGEDGTPVVLYGQKETALLPCIFGCLKAGHAYVPIDTSTPPSRAMEIIADVEPKAVVDFSGLLNPELRKGTVFLRQPIIDRVLAVPAEKAAPFNNWVRGDETVYILFTSGSTGKPKGVPITARNLASFYYGIHHCFGRTRGGVALNQVSYAFDVSCVPLYGALSRGMTLHTVDQAMTENLGALYEELRGSGLTYWASTPSFAELCLSSSLFSAELLPGLKTFLFCGEVLTHKLCDQLALRFPAARIINTYGPTEATVLVTTVEVTPRLRRQKRPIPIGKPIEGTTLEIDEETGELLIIGNSVGPGYLGRPDLTEERFFTDLATGKRGYHTGDIVEKIYATYYYRGRIDNQIKLAGHRVEIEDVERNLSLLPNIARAAVVPVMEGERVGYLTAFLLLERQEGLTNLQLSMRVRKLAAAFLPAYMIPRKIFQVDTFPLTVSGKIDKKVLAAFESKQQIEN